VIRKIAAVVLGGVVLLGGPAGATTKQEGIQAIEAVRIDLQVLYEYSTGKRPRLERVTCEGLRDSGHALAIMPRPRANAFWAAARRAGAAYEQVGLACLNLDEAKAGAALTESARAVRAAKRANPKLAKAFGAFALTAGGI
jgi:hypothetical protein